MVDIKSKKLGKGLSSLLSGKSFKKDGETSFINSLNTELRIGISKIKPNPNQPRKIFKKQDLENLASSIKEKGVIQPILVKKNENDSEYQIVAGERRWRAAQTAGLHEVPTIVKQLSDLEVIQAALIENLQRENLNPVEEAKAYKNILENKEVTPESLSKIIGKTPFLKQLL